MSGKGIALEDLAVGMTATFERTVSDANIEGFAEITGDSNPLHLDDGAAAASVFGGRVAHGLLVAGFLSAVFGTRLPGPGSIYVSQTLRFKAPVRPGDTVRARVTVAEIIHGRNRVRFDCSCSVGETVVLEGEAVILVPSRGQAT